jgi:hypothetical protein
MKKIYAIFFVLLFITALVGCSKDEPLPNVTDPQKAIIGKWEEVKIGTSRNNVFEVSPSGYTEYLTDSTYRFYDYETRSSSYGDYELNDSLLIYFYYDVDSEEDIDTISFRYYYNFENSKTLVLDIDAYAIFDISISKKIN